MFSIYIECGLENQVQGSGVQGNRLLKNTLYRHPEQSEGSQASGKQDSSLRLEWHFLRFSTFSTTY